jgi:hypothetical protein
MGTSDSTSHAVTGATTVDDVRCPIHRAALTGRNALSTHQVSRPRRLSRTSNRRATRPIASAIDALARASGAAVHEPTEARARSASKSAAPPATGPPQAAATATVT